MFLHSLIFLYFLHVRISKQYNVKFACIWTLFKWKASSVYVFFCNLLILLNVIYWFLPMKMCIVVFCLFSLLHHHLLYECSTVYLFTCLNVDGCLGWFSFFPMQPVLLRILLSRPPGTHVYPFLFLGVE